jgi:hypothetical protein
MKNPQIRWLLLSLLGGLVLGSFSARADLSDSDSDTVDAVEDAVVLPPEKPESTTDLLALQARIDAAFSAGPPVAQGFAIPSIRLSAYGDIGANINYRLSFGETREFTTVALPQILPVEAYVEWSTIRLTLDREDPAFIWRVGMFTPSFNPWWTPDLTYLQEPDYFAIHQALFMSRDIGTELAYEPSANGFRASIGVFNGNGILSLNTNNSRAFSASVSNNFEEDESQLLVGASGYDLTQSSAGSVNFKALWVSDFFANLTLKRLGLTVGGDFTVAGYTDSVTQCTPVGGTASVSLDVIEWLKLFGRAELLTSPPLLPTGTLQHYEIGPIFSFSQALNLYVWYDYLDQGNGNIQNSFQMRLRLVI